MARIRYWFTSGETLTYEGLSPDGLTIRTAAGTSLPEIGSTGYYTVEDANMLINDGASISRAGKVVGGGIVDADADDIVFLKDVAEGDMTIDTAQTPWQMVIKRKSTAVELVRKDMKTPAGEDITSAASIVGQTVEP